MGVLTEAAAKINAHFGHTVSDAALGFLTEAGLPSAIAEDICGATGEQPLHLYQGGITIIPSYSLESFNNDPLFIPWVRDGYLTIASGACGDPIAIDVRTTRIVYLIHDEMNHWAPDLVPSKHVVHTPLPYHDFWHLATGYDIALRDPQIGDSGLDVWLSLTGYTGVPVDADRAEARWGRGTRIAVHR